MNQPYTDTPHQNAARRKPIATFKMNKAAKRLGLSSGKKLLMRLRELNILDERNQPMPQYRKYFHISHCSFEHPVVGIKYYQRTDVTGAGLYWLQSFLKELQHAG